MKNQALIAKPNKLSMNCIIKKRTWLKSTALVVTASILSTGKLLAADPTKAQPEVENPLAIVLLAIMIGLLVAIGILSYVVIGAARLYLDKQKAQGKTDTKSAASKALSAMMLLCMLSTSLFAQTEPAASAPVVTSGIGGLSNTSFNTMIGVIGLEVLILIILTMFLQTFIRKEKQVVATAEVMKEPGWKTIWVKLNNFKSMREEAAITLDHNYDGIQELDNKLPPWWLYGFYACIVFACVYLYRFHVAHSAPSSIQEYETAMAKAEIEKQEYLKTSASKVDENTVTFLTDGSALESGKKLFVANCAACHGPEGQGIVGPNLTDDYWLHKGGIKDVFKTIKYGVPEKGMRSWKDDFSPVQIAQLASFIKSIHNSKPANPKEPQGDLYKEETDATTDSTATAAAK